MSLELMSLLLIGGMLVLLAFGVEIFVSMGLIAGLGLIFFVGQPIQQFAFSGWDLMNSFTMTAVPLFVFMGAIFANTGVIRTLFIGADKLIGALPGGVACSVLGANAIFGAISGSSVAATATFGKIAYPQMEELGYDPKLGLSSIAVGGTLSVLIPPSIILVVYGGWQEVSVSQLFAGGMIPGIILASLLMLTVVIRVKINPSLAPQATQYSWKERMSAIGDMLPFAATIIIVLGVIFTGIMTPTEAAAMGAFLSLVLALAYRKLGFKEFQESIMTAVKVTAMIAFVMITARVLGQVFQYIGLTQAFSGFMLDLPFGKYGILAIICVMYLIMGMFFDSFSMMVLTLPFISPLVTELGFSLIWFGVLFVILAEIGLVTPPFGLNLFVLHGVVPKHDIMTIVIGTLPFLIPMIFMIFLLTVFPQLVLWLPGILY